MASKDAPAPDIMNVREIIEFAFGDFEKSTVNFKLVQTVLFLIARQLRLLERRVIVEIGPLTVLPSDSTLSVTEVKIHAPQKTKSKTKDGAKPSVAGAKPSVGAAKPSVRAAKPSVAGAKYSEAGDKPYVGGAKPSLGAAKPSVAGAKYSEAGDKPYVGGAKPSIGAAKPSVAGAKYSEAGDKPYVGGEKSSVGAAKPSVAGAKYSEAGDKPYVGGAKPSVAGAKPERGARASAGTDAVGKKVGRGTQSSSDKTYTHKTSTDKTTSSADKTSTDKTTSSADKTSSAKTTSSADKTSTDKTTFSADKTSTDKTTSSADKTSTDKTTSSADKTSTDKTTSSADKTSTDKTTSSADKTYTDKTTSSADKTSTDKTISSADKTSTDKTTSSADKTSTDKTTSSADKTLTDQTTSSADKTLTDQTTSSADKTLTDQTTSSADKTLTDKTTSSADKTLTDQTTSSADKTLTDQITSSADKTLTDKTTSSADKTLTDQTTSSADKTLTDQTTSSADKTLTDITTSSADKTLTDQRTSSVDKASIDKTTSSADKTLTDKTTTTTTDQSSWEKTTTATTDQDSSEKTTTTTTDPSWREQTTLTSTDKPSSKTTFSDASTSRTTSSKDALGDRKPHSYHDILATLEEQRERELRIIHQRTDSFEETTKTPTPMASVSSMQYEKLLVVQKVSSTSSARSRESMHGRSTPQISVVTQEQFKQMADTVRQLEKKLLPVGTPGFPEHAELMEELRRGASLTDAMAALQLSARLEATEKTLASLISMVTELAVQTPGVELDSETRALLGISETWQRAPAALEDSEAVEDSEALEDSEAFEDRFEVDTPETGRNVRSGKGKVKGAKKGGKSMPAPSSDTAFVMSEIAETETTQAAPAPAARTDATPAEAETARNPFVTFPDLQSGARQMYDEMMKKIKAATARTSATAENAYKMSMKLEARLESALTAVSRMNDLENAVKQYAEQINALDTGLTSQMTNYQEQLTQMQHDLEIGLDTMAEVLGNAGGDTEGIAELHANFTNLQIEFEAMSYRQKALQDTQNSTAFDLEGLWRAIEVLRDTKSDREEVADALRDKAGISDLNGLVSLQQFEAVRGDFQKRIRAAYDKFNNQENIWQNTIEDTVRVLNEKADVIQLYSLKDEIHKYLTKIKNRMQVISDIVGEPKGAVVSKKVFRDTSCLSCGSPAHMDKEQPCMVPALPKFSTARQPAEGAEAESQTKGGGDIGICYPGLPISHPRDPRSHLCKRYCGGSHTVVTDGLNRSLPGLVVQQKTRTINAGPGTDGKLYLMDEQTKKTPCLPCNKPQPSPTDPEPQPQEQAPSDSFDDFGNITPPAHEMSYN